MKKSPVSSLRSFSLALLAAGALASPAALRAELLASFSGVNVNESTGVVVPADWADGVLQPSNFAPSAAITGRGIVLNEEARYSGWDATLNLDKYVSFRITPESGSVLNLTDFSFVAFSGSLRDVDAYNWGYRVNEGSGFGAWTFDQSYVRPTSEFTSRNSKSWDFADFSTTGTVEFAVFATETTADPAAQLTWRAASVNGSITAVPEPSTYGMMALGAACIAVVLIRRRKVASLS